MRIIQVFKILQSNWQQKSVVKNASTSTKYHHWTQPSTRSTNLWFSQFLSIQPILIQHKEPSTEHYSSRRAAQPERRLFFGWSTSLTLCRTVSATKSQPSKSPLPHQNYLRPTCPLSTRLTFERPENTVRLVRIKNYPYMRNINR
jgi:hypothetical protein